MTRDGKEFRKCHGCEGYWVSSDGEIRSQRKMGNQPGVRNDIWRKIVPHIDASGYYRVAICDGKPPTRRQRIHVLVLEAFDRPRPQGMVCRHLDGDKLNNDISNLKWGTESENRYDSVRHGTHTVPVGEAHPKAKLTADDVRVIRRRFSDGDNNCQIAAEYCVSHQSIQAIRTGKNWRSVQ